MLWVQRAQSRKFQGKRLFSNLAASLSLKSSLKDLVVDVNKLKSLKTTDIEELWLEYLASTANSVSGTSLSRETWEGIKDIASQSPLYVLPNIRETKGFCTMFTEYHPKDPFVLMTFLDDYRRLGTLADPWLSISFFEDLKLDKDLVLVQTKYDANQLLKSEAQVLTTEWIRRYSMPRTQANSPFMFNHKPENFDFQAAFELPK